MILPTWIKEKSRISGTVQQNNVYAQYLALCPMLSCRPSPAITIFTSLAFSFSTIPCWYFFQYKWTVGKIFFWKEIKWHFIFILYWFQLWQRIIFIVELIQLPGHELTILSELAFTSNVLTAWCLKYVFKEIHEKPMFLNTKNVFDGEAPDTKTEKHSKKFIAAILVPVMIGWLLQVLIGDGQCGLKHCVFTLTMVPMTLVSINGSSDLHVGQVLNRSSSWDRKTMNFGSVRILSELLDSLQNRTKKSPTELWIF